MNVHTSSTYCPSWVQGTHVLLLSIFGAREDRGREGHFFFLFFFFIIIIIVDVNEILLTRAL
jgi:hypothetical protein